MSTQFIAAIAALLVLAGCEGGGSPSIPTAPDSPVPPDSTVHTVRVLDNAFEPKFLQIAPGDSVRWILEGRSRHSIIEEDLRLFEVYLAKPGDSFVYQFRHGGYSTSYFCAGHGAEGMAGCIGVGEPPRCGWN